MGALTLARRPVVDDLAADDLALLAHLRGGIDDVDELDLEPDDLQLLARLRAGEEEPLG